MFDYPRLMQVFGEWLQAYPLDCGYFYRIAIDQVHSLVNGGSTDRITLCIDLVRNKWLDAWMSEHLNRDTVPLNSDALPVGQWDWNALRHGLLTHPRIELS